MSGMILSSGETVAVAHIPDFARTLKDEGLRTPFSEAAVQTLTALSQALMADRTAPPAFTALGYWLRPAALNAYRNAFEAGLPAHALASPRGLTFHLPPTNVDTIFVYSWALSLLAGNANIVRLPSDPNPAIQRLLPMVKAALEVGGLQGGAAFVSYPTDSEAGPALSLACDTRIIWGGDAKVNAIGEQPLKPGAVSIPFPDRFSYALIDRAAYAALSDAERDRLAAKAFNDVFLFDQLACSSSRVVFWRTAETTGWQAEAEDFARRCSAVAEARAYEVAPWTRSSKLLYAHQSALDVEAQAIAAMDPRMTSIFTMPGATPPRDIPGGGVLVHTPIQSLEEIRPFVRGKDQTLTHFGISLDALRAFAASLMGRGVDRIVPIGEALQFDRVWDGFDLLHSTSKLVVVR